MKNDTFTITFYNEKDEPISSSSSPSGSAQCYRPYLVGEWGDCENNTRTREVKKDYSVKCTFTKPAVPDSSEECGLVEDTINLEPVEEQVIKDDTGRNILIGILIIVIIFVGIGIIEMNKNKRYTIQAVVR